MSLKGKVALVTGSSKGIGRAIALRYAARGADIVVNYVRDEQAAAEVADEARRLGVRAITVRADVSDVAEIDRLFRTAVEEFGRLDIVVANAGIEKVDVPVTEVTEEDFDLLFRVNTKGPYFVLQAAARRIADGGRIINIASSSTARPQPGLGLYGTSKTAPKYLVRVLALELGHRGVTVNSLVPGPIDGAGIFTGTPDDDPYKKALRDSVPIGRLATPENVADFAEFLAGDGAAFLTGEEVLMNGGSSN
ncbi:glucose 1-dehydrogenase [Nocardia terpenica]|uniref:SDR family NAD(P)-dependent oxidoreductase n=1 Tax=Nocardia terpenica TaxID=455432 RepID=UPI001894BAFC|nr:glucose 1-dehydrogenase [Nocardia terpenica]MBF6065676.1 glucose 1-dehydrogenase [Nocardia terpenica]MBF6108286.1 glucose 1-dehydrogenase [Nocardia terpenica]MBF6115791.1 glucose 1-dehydrogenase [Nocardia terpenica]MBF6122921.1 glucose 1-dehydrogenase [Nocardia terpenica]MBF6156006.1 glucose 1-dehydrogenase [Nocardia terpenica]